MSQFGENSCWVH